MTYADFIQTLLLMVALVEVCYAIFNGKNSRRYRHSDGFRYIKR